MDVKNNNVILFPEKFKNSKVGSNQNSVLPIKTLWFVGLSGSGKSTIAKAFQDKLLEDYNININCLDGDNVRAGLCSDLGFSNEDRKENLRRVAQVAKLFNEFNIPVITSFISPLEKGRETCREILKDKYCEVYIKANIEECEKRDPKGIYKKVRAGEIKQFTGISSPFDEPQDPDLVLDTQKFSVEECVQQLMEYNFNFKKERKVI